MDDARQQDETRRQRALDAYHVVDSLPEQAYDDIVQVAAAVCETPIALVSLIDRDRQWFKAKIGIDDAQTDRDVAVCDHAIRQPDRLMEIPDLSSDPRFADYPHVAGDFAARFYAGMPLVTPAGDALGTVCVLDHKPRQLTDAQRDALRSLARITMSMLENRSHKRELERAAAVQPAVAAPTDARGYTLAILELQDFAGVIGRLGERATEKAMAQLDQELERCLQGDPDDIVNRATGSPEFTVIFHGHDNAETVENLRDCLKRHHEKTGLTVLLGASEAAAPDEPLPHVFARADRALSAAKDEWGRRQRH